MYRIRGTKSSKEKENSVEEMIKMLRGKSDLGSVTIRPSSLVYGEGEQIKFFVKYDKVSKDLITLKITDPKKKINVIFTTHINNSGEEIFDYQTVNKNSLKGVWKVEVVSSKGRKHWASFIIE